MDSELQILNNNGLTMIDQREVLGKDFKIYGDTENPLFVAKDVANWIEHSKASIMLDGIDEDEKLRETIFTSGQNREMWFLTEDGLYEVLMQSRKPIAKQFKKKIKEILKSIRRTGTYAAQPKALSPLEQLRVQYQVLEDHQEKINEMSIKVNKLENRMTIDYGQQQELHTLANRSVIKVLGGKDTPAYKELSKKAFSTIWRDFKRVMNVSSYRNTAVKEFERAVRFLKEWKPNRGLSLMITGANSQLILDVE